MGSMAHRLQYKGDLLQNRAIERKMCLRLVKPFCNGLPWLLMLMIVHQLAVLALKIIGLQCLHATDELVAELSCPLTSFVMGTQLMSHHLGRWKPTSADNTPIAK